MGCFAVGGHDRVDELGVAGRAGDDGVAYGLALGDLAAIVLIGPRVGASARGRCRDHDRGPAR